MTRYEKTVLLVAACLILVISAIGIFGHRSEEEIFERRPHLHAVIDLGSHPDINRTLIVGYNYHLLQEFALLGGQGIEISLNSHDNSSLDSLKHGYVDILVLPYRTDLELDSVLVSQPLDSSFVWLMKESDVTPMKELNIWLDSLSINEDFHKIRDSFLRRFSAHNSRPRAKLSPYDDLIKAHADSLGWDWRMLAAIIYKESRFHIEAHSRRGAKGLMQLMPHTASQYGVTDPLDPEENIAAATRLLQDLTRRYSKFSASAEECFKYSLAAYNAGTGRIKDILGLAENRNINTAYWDSVAVVIPDMSKEEVLDTGIIKFGPFKGIETLAYVDEVMSIYREFVRICP